MTHVTGTRRALDLKRVTVVLVESLQTDCQRSCAFHCAELTSQ